MEHPDGNFSVLSSGVETRCEEDALFEEMNRTRPQPIASVPLLPAGYEMLTDASRGGLLPWAWAVERLTKAHNYWISTVRPDGRPHVVPVWGCWLDDKFMFSTSRDSVKAHNLARNPSCVLCPENAAEAIMVEGKVEEVTDRALLEGYLKIYNAKYDWNQDLTQGPFFRVRPARVLAFVEDRTGSATRWTFATRRKTKAEPDLTP